MIRLAGAVLALLFSTIANATFISGNHEYAPGEFADLQGLEWLPLWHTQGLSRIDVENGFTDQVTGDYWHPSDWRYATRRETETLINSLWGQRYSGYSHDNFDGAQWFVNTFGNTETAQFPGGVFSNSNITNIRSSSFIFGDNDECFSPVYECTFNGTVATADYIHGDIRTFLIGEGVVSITSQDFGFGYLVDEQGGGFGLRPFNSFIPSYGAYPGNGSLLVREFTYEIPEPKITSLFWIALIGLSVSAVSRNYHVTHQ